MAYMDWGSRHEYSEHTFFQLRYALTTSTHVLLLYCLCEVNKTACVALSGFANVQGNREDFKYDLILVYERRGLCHADVVDGGLVTAQRTLSILIVIKRKYSARRVWKGEAQLNMERIQKAVY